MTTTPRSQDSQTLTTIPECSRNPAALSILHAAWEAARDLETASSEFAVEIHQLYAAGATSTDLRWLIAKGFTEHLLEIVRKDGQSRSFHHPHGLAFTDQSCFVLTEAGCQLAILKTSAANVVSQLRSPGSTIVPKWDGIVRQLSVSGRLVKQFRLPAKNQETILMALEEDGWPPRIDDPLPARNGGDRRARLHDAIKGLNRNQINKLLSFGGDGTGCGVMWKTLVRFQDGSLA
jgi:hypothetical protein